MNKLLEQLGQIEIQFKILEAQKISVTKKLLEMMANGSSSESTQDGETQEAPKPTTED